MLLPFDDSPAPRKLGHASCFSPRTWFIGSTLAASALFAAPAWAASADLVLNHSVTPDPALAGGVATFTITVSNNGPDGANDVSLLDTLPPGSTFVAVNASQGACTAATGTVTCALGSIANNNVATVNVEVLLPKVQVWENTASVSSSTPDSNTDNNQLVRHITTTAAADLTLALTPSASSLIAGQPFNYTAVATNIGPNDLPSASAHTVTIQVPTGVMFTGMPHGNGWSCSPGNGYPLASGAVTCTRNDGLPVGDAAPTITVPAVATATGTATAAGGVGSSYEDPNLANNGATANVTVTEGADLKLSKWADPSSAVGVGSTVAFKLTARLEGGVAPHDVVVTDTLPAGLRYESISAPAPWSCNTSALPSIRCTYPGKYTGGNYSDLPVITVNTTVTAEGTHTNTGTVSATEADPVPGNNTATATATGSNTANLITNKTASLSPVALNTPYHYTVTPRNQGPLSIAATQTMAVVEKIPAGMSLTALPTGNGWACSVPTGTTYPAAGPIDVTCTRTGYSLGVPANAPAITVPVINTVAGALTNTACVGLSGAGPTDDPSDNCGTAAAVGSSTSADLWIHKASSPATVVAGQPLTYTLTVHNAGPDTATNVVVKDQLGNLLASEGLKSMAITSGGTGTCTKPTQSGWVNAECTIASLAKNGTAVITLVVVPTNTQLTDLPRSNTATVKSSDVGDPVPGNNGSNTVTNVITPTVDLTVTKTVTPNPVRVGEPLTYVITAVNKGPSAAGNVQISDTMPANMAFVSATPNGGGTCTTPAVDATSGTVECTWSQLGSGSQQTANITLRPLPAAVGTTISNTVHVSTDSPETDKSNNSATATAEVIAAQLDILVKKVDSVDPLPLGAETEYTITVSNVGPSYGSNLVVVDTFPGSTAPTALFSYQGGLRTSVPGTCTEPAVGAVTGTLECHFPSIAPGTAGDITIQYKMRAESIVTSGAYSGTQSNAVSVKVDEAETESANNATVEDTTTRRDAIGTDLGITKTADLATAKAGDTVVYTLAVTNHGPLDSTGAQVIDTLPAGVSFVSASAGCNALNGVVSCGLGTLANGASTSFTITVQLNDPYDGASPLANTAQVDAPGDTDPDNNTSTTTTNVPGTEHPVPTLGEWAMLLLLAALAGMGARQLRRR